MTSTKPTLQVTLAREFADDHAAMFYEAIANGASSFPFSHQSFMMWLIVRGFIDFNEIPSGNDAAQRALFNDQIHMRRAQINAEAETGKKVQFVFRIDMDKETAGMLKVLTHTGLALCYIKEAIERIALFTNNKTSHIGNVFDQLAPRETELPRNVAMQLQQQRRLLRELTQTIDTASKSALLTIQENGHMIEWTRRMEGVKNIPELPHMPETDAAIA